MSSYMRTAEFMKAIGRLINEKAGAMSYLLMAIIFRASIRGARLMARALIHG